MSDNELGGFLRARREAVTPAEVGLPDGPRRRTPGLRRAELATLAGISVEYLTRLEQGRDRRPSPEVLQALASALQLSSGDRELLIHAATGSGGACPDGTEPPERTVRPTVLALLERLEPAPAVILNRLGDVVAFTTGYERLVGALGLLDTEPPNLLRFVFTDQRARSVYPEWDRVADELVARLKCVVSREDPYGQELADELLAVAGDQLTDRLMGPPEVPSYSGIERLEHPEVGELTLSYEAMEVPDADAQRLVVYLPADDATSSALDHLAGRHPGALRAVNG